MKCVFVKVFFLIVVSLAFSSIGLASDSGSNRTRIYETVMNRFVNYKVCTTQAAARYAVPEWILMAVIKQENGPFNGYLSNKDGTKDYGVTCINDKRFTDFKQGGFEHITPELIMKDPCVAIQVTAYLLKKEEIRERKRAKSTNWLTVAANYHYNHRGKFPGRHEKYKKHIKNVLDRFRRALNVEIAKK